MRLRDLTNHFCAAQHDKLYHAISYSFSPCSNVFVNRDDADTSRRAQTIINFYKSFSAHRCNGVRPTQQRTPPRVQRFLFARISIRFKCIHDIMSID